MEQPVLNLNERRTRRGVYAISKPTSESSGDSDGDNDSNKKPLADALDIPADGEMELTTAECDISSLSGPVSNPPTRLPSTAASLNDLERSSTSSGPTPSLSGSTSFRSTISTRLLRAKGPTPRSASLTAAKVASNSESMNSQRRLTRSISLLQLSEKAKGKGKAKASPAPGTSSTSVKLAKGSGKDDGKGGTLENEPRGHQTRPGLTPVEAAAPKKPVVLRDSDGKPLPTCANCSSVLPLITVDSKVVWGLEIGKKDKNTKRECPR